MNPVSSDQYTKPRSPLASSPVPGQTPLDRGRDSRPPMESRSSYSRGSRDTRRAYYSSPHNDEELTSDIPGASLPQHAIYDSMHRLNSSEPSFLDVRKRPESGSSPTPARRPEAMEPYNRFANFSPYYGGSSVAAPRSHLHQAYSHKHRTPPRQTEQDTPTMFFRDPYEVGSVGTGMSQQELIRKKARSESTRRKEKKFKKKKNRIVNLPSTLLMGGTSTPPSRKYIRGANESVKDRVKKPRAGTGKLPSTVRRFDSMCILAVHAGD
jgi:hypothetical protein